MAYPGLETIKDTLFHSVQDSHNERERFLVYILPGNPGLVQFYEPFAKTLAQKLQEQPATRNAITAVCGKSYRGFEITRDNPPTSHGSISLNDTVLGAEADLRSVAGHFGSRGTKTKIILLGHSVGAYILAELLQRQAESGEHPEMSIVGGIMVCPTITHIGKSRTGRILAPILAIPFFATIVGAAVSWVASFLPFRFVYHLARLMTRFPPAASTTVAHFLRSRNGVKQALWLGKEEMEIITEDRWSNDVWGHGLPTDPSLYMFFGANDHYVPNWARDELIRNRGYVPERKGARGEPRAFIDDSDLPHSWCIDHSSSVAERVVPWIEEIVAKHKTHTLQM